MNLTIKLISKNVNQSFCRENIKILFKILRTNIHDETLQF